MYIQDYISVYYRKTREEVSHQVSSLGAHKLLSVLLRAYTAGCGRSLLMMKIKETCHAIFIIFLNIPLNEMARIIID